jgi:hypothetical protein
MGEQFLEKEVIVQKRRASPSDFDRFKLMLAKIKACNYSNIIPCAILQKQEILFRKCFEKKNHHTVPIVGSASITNFITKINLYYWFTS